MLRDGALSRPDVIEFINARMIPVWVNVRRERFPFVPAIAHMDWELILVGDRRVTHPYFYFYYVRSFVFSPDQRLFLNEAAGRMKQVWGFGPEYLDMLRAAVASYEQAKRARP